MRAQWILGVLLGPAVGWTAGCAGSTAAGSTAPAVAAAANAGSALPLGVWAEYWAVNGGVDTQRYLFLENGRFVWRAPEQAGPNTSIQKSGTFTLEPQPSGAAVLVLNVKRERFAACAAQCSHHDAGPRTVQYPRAIVERYEIGECAPNLEAQALDTHYACRAIGGRSFWRRAAPNATDLADFAD